MAEPQQSASSQHRVSVTVCTDNVPDQIKPWLRENLSAAVTHAGIGRARLNIALVDDAEMTRLHGRFLGQSRTTDVLSFDMRAGDKEAIDGEIVICVPEAVRQAAILKHETRLEILLYAIHGMLHLAGYDDHGPRQAARMHRLEDRLLATLGFGPVYAPRPHRPSNRLGAQRKQPNRSSRRRAR